MHRSFDFVSVNRIPDGGRVLLVAPAGGAPFEVVLDAGAARIVGELLLPAPEAAADIGEAA